MSGWDFGRYLGLSHCSSHPPLLPLPPPLNNIQLSRFLWSVFLSLSKVQMWAPLLKSEMTSLLSSAKAWSIGQVLSKSGGKICFSVLFWRFVNIMLRDWQIAVSKVNSSFVAPSIPVSSLLVFLITKVVCMLQKITEVVSHSPSQTYSLPHSLLMFAF